MLLILAQPTVARIRTLITGTAVGPMERVKVSKEGITVTNSMNTVSWWNLNKIKKNELAAKLGMEGS